jgi:O-antigen ligase
MANESFALPYTQSRLAGTGVLPAIAFTLFLALVFIGLEPFNPRLDVSAYGGVTRGDALRQVSYVLVFGLILFASAQAYGLAMARAVPLTIGLLLAWCLASMLWAEQPSVVIRRAGLEVIVVLSVFLGVEAVGAQKAFAIWKWMLLAILVVNWLSIPVIPAAKHFATEMDTALIGNWRGLYGHKNITGAVCAITAIVFLFTRNGKGNWFGILVALAATGFLLNAHSKSSLGFLPLAAAAGLAYRYCWKDGLSRAIVTVLGATLLLALGLATIFYADALNKLLSDPTEFTGRSAIWAAELAFIADHPLLGSGFGTFANAGGPSPLAPYATSIDTDWVQTVSHGHNGYLQVFVTIGGVGFLLTMLGVVVSPAMRFWQLNRSEMRPLLFALFAFTLLHNVMESDLLEGDGVSWTTMLLVIAMLRSEAQFAEGERNDPVDHFARRTPRA